MNQVHLIGNVGNTPEIKNLESGSKLAKFSLATNERYKNSQGETVEETQWHSINVWGKQADIIQKYVKKGDQIGITGKITNRSYENPEGHKSYFTDIVAKEIHLLSNKNPKP